MADTAVEAVMDIVTDLGGSGSPRTVVEALGLLREAIGAISDDIEAAVDAWLDDHPEATTTVQDGAITHAKLHSDVAGELARTRYYLDTVTIDGTQQLAVMDAGPTN